MAAASLSLTPRFSGAGVATVLQNRFNSTVYRHATFHQTQFDPTRKYAKNWPSRIASCGPIMPITVSIVEDNEQLRATLARVLNRSDGFRCSSHYGSAEEALKDLPTIKPEVVLMDINLPGINGVECV